MTYRVTRCIGCNCEDLTFRFAITAPFIAAAVLKKAAFVCRIAQCQVCRLIFFEDRFDDQEAAELYTDYRSEAYYRARHRWEPWYTSKFNAFLGGAEEMAHRRARYANTVLNHVAAKNIETVLDYGGDRGQLMVGGPGKAQFVFDISGVDPEPGVSTLNVASLAGKKFDLVLLCEVLEHVSDPMRILLEVIDHVQPGGLLYVTVPNREFPFADIPSGAWYSNYLRALLKCRWAILALDFWSTGFRVKFGRVAPLAFVKMHEHINFFDQFSLTQILQRAGLIILSSYSLGKDNGLTAICQRPV